MNTMPKVNGHGEGSFDTRSNGARRFRIKANGRTYEIQQRKRESRKAFLARAHELRAQVNAGQGHVVDYTVGQFLTYWLSSQAERVSDKTLNDYRIQVDKHIRPFLGGARLRDIGPIQLQMFYERLRIEQRSRDMVRRVHTRLSSAFNQAVIWGAMTDNPCDKVSPPKHEVGEREHLTPDEIPVFLLAAEGSTHYALFYTQISCALRPSEALGLLKSDCYLDGDRPHILVRGTKNKNARRTVMVTRRTAAVIQDEIRRRMADGIQTQLVFCNGAGNRINLSNIRNRHLPAILQAAGIDKNVTPHGLRHAGVTLAQSMGMSPKARHERHGHQNERSESTYLHPDETLQAAEISKLEGVI